MRPAPIRPRRCRRLRRYPRLPGLVFQGLESRTPLAGFLVNTTADSGPGSPRQAILDANGNPGADEIHFAIPGPGFQTITPQCELPWITDAVLIDGASQPGYGGKPLIQIDGRRVASGNGLTIASTGSTITGLAIGGFSGGAGIRIIGTSGNLICANAWDGLDLSGASLDLVQGNFIGLGADGSGPLGNGARGISMWGGAEGNTIGGAEPGAGNVISDNG